MKSVAPANMCYVSYHRKPNGEAGLFAIVGYGDTGVYSGRVKSLFVVMYAAPNRPRHHRASCNCTRLEEIMRLLEIFQSWDVLPYYLVEAV